MKLSGMVLAVTDLPKMRVFYKEVFQVDFEKTKIPQGIIYSGNLANFTFTLCPAEIAKNTATQNRHQLEFEVLNLGEILQKVVQYGGSILGQKSETEFLSQASIYDPDQNSIVLKQQK